MGEGYGVDWAFRIERVDEGRGARFALDRDARPATFEEVLRAWQDDPAFASRFSDALADAPFDAFRWETPAVRAGSTGRPFEFVLLDSPALARRAEPTAFAAHFECAGEAEVLEFPSLGGDATLIVPCPIADPTAYGHLAAFVRGAPESQRRALWKSVGGAMTRRLGDRPVWLSTSGAGVPWLHVRLDDRPKYYGFGPYRQDE